MIVDYNNMDVNCKQNMTSHARIRQKERNIQLNGTLTIDVVKKMPIYTTDNGCVKYLDIPNQIVYYVRGDKIVTMIRTNRIQMLRYYAFSKKIDFNSLCRDHIFNTCNRGCACKYVHIDYR